MGVYTQRSGKSPEPFQSLPMKLSTEAYWPASHPSSTPPSPLSSPRWVPHAPAAVEEVWRPRTTTKRTRRRLISKSPQTNEQMRQQLPMASRIMAPTPGNQRRRRDKLHASEKQRGRRWRWFWPYNWDWRGRGSEDKPCESESESWSWNNTLIGGLEHTRNRSRNRLRRKAHMQSNQRLSNWSAAKR
jgi:hypothetical protein